MIIIILIIDNCILIGDISIILTARVGGETFFVICRRELFGAFFDLYFVCLCNITPKKLDFRSCS